MSCKEWKTDWVARLYDELEPDEQRVMDRHLCTCAECRATLDQLGSSSRLLRESAPTPVATPRVVVLETRRTWPTVWAFAAGAACALIVFAVGLKLGPQLNPSARPARNTLQALEQRLATLETRPAVQTEPLTDQQARQSIDELERRFNRARSQDLDYVMQTLTASEMRTGHWLDQTHDALTLLALRQDPRFSEQ